MLHRLSALQTLRFYGQIPECWIQLQETTLTVSCSQKRWWREPGFSS
jgi:hypothetical protein